ncbi:Hypothetical protein CINCED_3A024468 [Cinara cedri]|uniref:Uncharacterized protein n=1 Tax=Cinara cedri TaxID=506608 RepID=A0A5E4N7N6_9HEMI|nr:Hypothetical protein CINCED_3A024468 [Cinara cedri]
MKREVYEEKTDHSEDIELAVSSEVNKMKEIYQSSFSVTIYIQQDFWNIEYLNIFDVIAGYHTNKLQSVLSNNIFIQFNTYNTNSDAWLTKLHMTNFITLIMHTINSSINSIKSLKMICLDNLYVCSLTVHKVFSVSLVELLHEYK